MKIRPLFASVVLSLCGSALPAAEPEIVFEKDIEYANPAEQHLKLNMARPKEIAGELPAIICIHGGGFRAGSREGYDGLVKKLAAQGYVAMTIEYRLAPKYKFPAAVYDCKAAVRWVRANAKELHVDPDRIGVTGGSAGGHLVLFLGVTAGVAEFDVEGGNDGESSVVNCVVDYFGPSDFTKSYGKSVDAAEVLPLWLGGNAEEKHKEHILASPLYWVTPRAAPTLIVHGTLDQYVAFEQGQWMYDKMKAADVDVELLKIEGAKHGFQGADAEKADKAMIEFFDKHLKKK
jgi:acetyl esterase/lipase